MRKFICAAFVLLIGITFANGDEFTASILKIEDGKIVHYKRSKKGKAEIGKLMLSDKVKVVKAVANPTTKKIEGGDPIEGGIKNEIFTKPQKYLGVRLITEGEGDKEIIVEIRVVSVQKK